MVIGNGMIANIFKNNILDLNVDSIFFASGVSNSLETDIKQFQREENLISKIIAAHPTKTFIYFSTCSIYDPSKTNSPYVLHKLHMENLIQSQAKNFLIARISNAVGKGGNPNLLINYLVNNIKNNIPIVVHKKATRNLIDIQDIQNLVFKILENNFNSIQNIAYPENFSILEIICEIEKYFSKKAIVAFLDKGENYTIDTKNIEKYFEINNKQIKMDYLFNMLKQYY